MYPSESVEFVSKSWSRLETALKKLSWIVGSAEDADEVLVVLFFWLLATFCVFEVPEAFGEDEDIGASEAGAVISAALVVLEEYSETVVFSTEADFSNCEVADIVGDEVVFVTMDAVLVLDTSFDSIVDFTSCAIGVSATTGWAGASVKGQISS
jgi:hypothetical protein